MPSTIERTADRGVAGTTSRVSKRSSTPGLPQTPQHELAKRQMSGSAPLITFETVHSSVANDVLKRVRVGTLCESLGCVETLISPP